MAGGALGEIAGLYATDVDWKPGRRHVRMSLALVAALRAHGERIEIEGSVKGWTDATALLAAHRGGTPERTTAGRSRLHPGRPTINEADSVTNRDPAQPVLRSPA
jgi:hypothetical protein